MYPPWFENANFVKRSRMSLSHSGGCEQHYRDFIGHSRRMRPTASWFWKFGLQDSSSGFTHLSPGNRAKSRSVVCSTPPYSMVIAANCASVAIGPLACPSRSILRSKLQWRSPGVKTRSIGQIHPLLDQSERTLHRHLIAGDSCVCGDAQKAVNRLPGQTDQLLPGDRPIATTAAPVRARLLCRHRRTEAG